MSSHLSPICRALQTSWDQKKWHLIYEIRFKSLKLHLEKEFVWYKTTSMKNVLFVWVFQSNNSSPCCVELDDVWGFWNRAGPSLRPKFLFINCQSTLIHVSLQSQSVMGLLRPSTSFRSAFNQHQLQLLPLHHYSWVQFKKRVSS